MTDSRPTKRKPLSDPLLIRYRKEWQVCYKARGLLNGKVVEAWVYGPDSIFFCEAHVAAETLILPYDAANKLDPFNYIVDRVDAKGVPIERLAGAQAASAALAAYEYFTGVYHDGVRLRNGLRLMHLQGAKT